jgi:hypothetical protein
MLYKNKMVLITFFTLSVGLLSFLLSLNSVSFQDNGLFVIHETNYYNAEEYSIGSSLSSVAAYNFENLNSYEKENDEQFVGSQTSSADFNFALVGDWGCTKNTKKTVKLIQNHDPDIILALEIHHMHLI